MKRHVIWFSVSLMPFAAMAGTSANYRIEPAALDNGGLTTSSANYRANSSAAPGVAISSLHYSGRTGFAGQLGDVVATAIALNASPLTLDEGGTRQLSATLVYDDQTTSALAAGSITWSVQSGPISGISATGLATAGTVYQNTAAIVRGVYQTFSDTLDLTVLNADVDDFGSYASDGLPDDWQVLYFGAPPNASAAALADPDSDGQDNIFEYTAGLLPTDSLSHFTSGPARISESESQRQGIVFSPRLSDRNYTVEESATLEEGSWTILGSFTTVDDGPQRTVIDTGSLELKKFYRVKISRP
jgi:hypothetical protein